MLSITKIKEMPADQIPTVLLITGEEDLLMRRYLKALIQQLIPKELHDLNLVYFEGKDISVNNLLESLETLPVMAERKLVVVKNPSFLEARGISLSEAEEKKLMQYLKRPETDTCLVFFCEQKPDGRKKLVKSIKSVARSENFPRLKETELQQFILQEISSSGNTIEDRGLKLFMESFDYFGSRATQNLQDVANEISKLSAYKGSETHITRMDIEEMTQAAFQNDIFLLIDSFANRRAAETQVRLRQLLISGEPLMKIIGYLRNQFKLMLQIQALSGQGYSAGKMATILKQHPYTFKKSMRYSHRFRHQDLVFLLNGFLKLDRQMKQGILEAQTSLELLIVSVCEKNA